MLAHSEAQAIVRTAIRNAGGVTKWARRFGIQRGSIYEWIERAEVPSDRANPGAADNPRLQVSPGVYRQRRASSGL